MSVTDVLSILAIVVHVSLTRDLHLNILMRLHDSLRFDGVIELLTVDPSVGSADGLCINSQLNLLREASERPMKVGC